MEPRLLSNLDKTNALTWTRCRGHPLTILDDHSRFNLCLAACENERTATVKERLIVAFQRYGMPERMAMDNGSPWGNQGDSVLSFTDE
jgi:transposase InsO family protein